MREIVNLHIESLQLEGIPERDKHSVAEGIRRELARLLNEGGIPAGLLNGSPIPSIDGGAYTAGKNVGPEAAGTSIAQAIYKGMH